MREAKGENLMLRRTLLKESLKEDTTQRRALFQVQCKVNGKLCKLIIDSGSIDNIISLEVVNKLKLERLPHSCPYKVSWLNKGQQEVVNEKAWVEFNIGEYKDKILCDIFPMDACHLLLGRP